MYLINELTSLGNVGISKQGCKVILNNRKCQNILDFIKHNKGLYLCTIRDMILKCHRIFTNEYVLINECLIKDLSNRLLKYDNYYPLLKQSKHVLLHNKPKCFYVEILYFQ